MGQEKKERRIVPCFLQDMTTDRISLQQIKFIDYKRLVRCKFSTCRPQQKSRKNKTYLEELEGKEALEEVQSVLHQDDDGGADDDDDDDFDGGGKI